MHDFSTRRLMEQSCLEYRDIKGIFMHTVRLFGSNLWFLAGLAWWCIFCKRNIWKIRYGKCSFAISAPLIPEQSRCSLHYTAKRSIPVASPHGINGLWLYHKAYIQSFPNSIKIWLKTKKCLINVIQIVEEGPPSLVQDEIGAAMTGKWLNPSHGPVGKGLRLSQFLVLILRDGYLFLIYHSSVPLSVKLILSFYRSLIFSEIYYIPLE